jgi:hypothetical protein
MGKFDKEIGRSLFRDIKGICRARSYEPLISLYTLAKEHNLEKREFFEFFNPNRNRSDGADFNNHFQGSAF